MDITIDDIPKRRVRKIRVKSGAELYAVAVSVSRRMSASGFANFICDKDHIYFDNNRYILHFKYDMIRTFKIKDNNGRYTTAQLSLADVAESHIVSIEERRLERAAARLKELNKAYHDTVYYAIYVRKGTDNKIFHSFRTVEEVKKAVRNELCILLNSELNNNILHRGALKYDTDISCNDDGYLLIKKTVYIRDAFASKKNTPEFKPSEVKETRYFVRNDKKMHITTWDWTDVVNDLKLKQEMNDKILHEERDDDEWRRVQDIARKNIKAGNYRVLNLSGIHTDSSNEMTGIFGCYADDIDYLKLSVAGF